MFPAPRNASISSSSAVRPLQRADELLARAASVGLVAPAILNQVRASGKLTDAQSAAQALCDHGHLSPYQAQKLLAGDLEGYWIDRYQVLDLLGKGATSQVFLAKHPTLDRQVAVKVLNSNPPQSALERFHREARVAASLNHPHIVQAFDAVSNGRLTYLVLEYVPGQTLDRRVAQSGRIPWPEAAGFMAQTAAALEYAHQSGVVHRDVKPANLIATPEGRVKILDLGLVLVRDCSLNLTAQSPGAILGTPDFVAPEQARDGHKVDARADVYALGCTFYHLLAGVSPFPSRSLAEKLIAHQSKPPRPIRELVPEVPEGVAQILDKMMAKWPEERYQTAADVCAALLPFVERPELVEGRPNPAAQPQSSRSGWWPWRKG
jgi:serine/threonine-protein kinase